MNQHIQLAQVGALICLAAFSSQQAMAQVSGTFGLSGVAYQLTDLDLNDGITPTLTWADATFDNHLYYSEQQAPWIGDGGGPIFHSVSNQSEVIAGRVDTRSELLDAGVRTSASLDAASVSFSLPLGASVNAGSEHKQAFTLSPHTQVTFTGRVNGWFTGDIPTGIAVPNGYFDWDHIALYENASMELTASGDTRIAKSFSSSSLGGRSSEPGFHTDQARDTMLTVTLFNSKDVALPVSLNWMVAVRGYTVRPLIPEPSTFSQFLLGGALLLGMARGHRRRAPVN